MNVLSLGVRTFGACCIALVVSSVPLAVSAQDNSAPRRPIPGTNCTAFPADSWWNADVSRLPVHRRSAEWMAQMSPDNNLHPDFGPADGEQDVPYGVPITIADRASQPVQVRFQNAEESNRVAYPLGPNTKVEGGPNATGDRRTVTVDPATCWLYETYGTRFTNGSWSADVGAVWNLGEYTLRPDGWVSADTAGLPILPGLLRWDEVAAGRIDHAIRFTTDATDQRYIWPARHQAGSVDDPSYPPMGGRFRLQANYRIDPSLRPDTKAVLQAFKRYGLVLADKGSPWFFQGAADRRWPEELIEELKQIPGSAFEAVDTSSLMISPDSMQVRTRQPLQPAVPVSGGRRIEQQVPVAPPVRPGVEPDPRLLNSR
jgi:hypothetical protein